MDVLERVKLALGVSHSKKDSLFLDSISACRRDLESVGIVYAGEDDPLIQMAKQLYCQALYSPEVTQRAEFKKLYDDLKQSLCGTTGYSRKAAADE